MKFFSSVSLSILASFIFGCSGSGRYIEKEDAEVVSSLNYVRLLIEETENEKEINVESDCFLFIEDEKEKLITTGENLLFSLSGNNLSLRIGNDYYYAEYFQLIPVDTLSFLKYNGTKIRGKIKIININSAIAVINSIDIESYLKGILPKEMPLGKGEQNYEALKAFAVCARTYSLTKIKPGNYFDLYPDTRDQVYGGVESENPISNRAVDETKNIILTFDGKPATVFYFSTCAGKTENVKNIFNKDSIPYLEGIEDNYPPYCSISPSFEWEETYTPEIFIERLKNAGLVSSDFDILENIYVINRFESGRVNELEIELLSSQTGETTFLTLAGNNIRSIIRTSNNKSILKSIWFDVILDEDKNVIITGKGYGHGVGFCQWGSVGMAREGNGFEEILLHYFPVQKFLT